MAIDAVISAVKVERGEVWLELAPRPGEGSGPGQSALRVLNPPDPPEKLEAAVGVEIWGNSSQILIGETVWAEREGYTRIRLVDRARKQ